MSTDVTLLDPLSVFGGPADRARAAVAAIRAGRGVIVCDDPDRENEGDFIFAADHLTVEQMATMIRDGSGIVCLVLTAEKADALELPPMVIDNTARNGTAFTVSIEARVGVTTGVSAADRVCTVRTALKDDAQPGDLARPGHVFPLRAHPGGVRARQGHTEATIELLERAGCRPVGVLCEVMNPDGTMARLPELVRYARDHGFAMVTITDLLGASEPRSLGDGA